MARSYLTSFIDLFSLNVETDNGNIKINKIIIPAIQRDYAQGRTNPEIEKIRNKFLSTLKDAIVNNPIYLDFIYGDINKDGVLTPLDGQQRLTTLFLIHWYAAKKNNTEEINGLLNSFSYEIRPSSRNFCEYLISFNPILEMNKQPLSSQIINESWFPLDWKNDPTINSMLLMIDEIDKKFSDIDNLLEKLKNNKIMFYFLPIKNMGLTDELYIKMNSRGKPLTSFEHFKAEFEHRIKLIDISLAKEFERKIETKWTDFLWKYRNDDCLIDDLFLNYFKFICDLICYEENGTPQKRSYDEFDLIDLYFGENDLIKAKKHLEYLISCFDCWCDLDNKHVGNVFELFLDSNSLPNKARFFGGNVNLLDDCFKNYIDSKTGRRDRNMFSFSKFLLLYSFLVYAKEFNEINQQQFNERIRIINNLVLNSTDEMNDSEDRVGGNRLPAIIKQTYSIISKGIIIGTTNEIGINYNSNQIEEEIEKQRWRAENQDYINSLNLLENHDLLQGQISVVGLENKEIFDNFSKLFNCDRDLVSCALLIYGDYFRIEKNCRYTFGTKSNSTSWKFLFHKSLAAGFENTKQALVNLLKDNKTINNEKLNEIINIYIDKCESNKTYNWKYYFIKYKEFRPDTYGKYLIKDSKFYSMVSLWARTQLSEKAFQPFLKIIDSNHLDKFATGKRLNYNNNHFVYCEEKSFLLKNENDEVLNEIKINQNENKIDTEDRILKYKNNPFNIN